MMITITSKFWLRHHSHFVHFCLNLTYSHKLRNVKVVTYNDFKFIYFYTLLNQFLACFWYWSVKRWGTLSPLAVFLLSPAYEPKILFSRTAPSDWKPSDRVVFSIYFILFPDNL